MDIQAERAAKVTNVVQNAWITAARKYGHCSEDFERAVSGNVAPPLVKFHPDEFALPQDWLSQDPALGQCLADDLNFCLPSGLTASFHKAVSSAIGDLASLVGMLEKTGKFVSAEKLPESSMQEVMMQHLISREVDVIEGAKVGGGETDLVLTQQIVVENKVIQDPISNPLDAGSRFSWQARRYSTAYCNNVAFVVLAYCPRTEADLLALPKRVRVFELPESTEERCEVRFVIPWGKGVPSKAKSP